jgi:hypothetical protein
MREFDLVSVDWETVRLMQAGQFKQETFYLEELVRWVLQRGRLYGLLHLADNGISRPSPEGQQTFSVSVRGCFAVGAEGHIIEIPDDRRMALQGVLEARSSSVPLYVGVSKVERESVPELHPSVDTGLLQCGGRRRAYRLSADNSDDSLDWVQIAQFDKTMSGLSPDPDFIPECLFLGSHSGLRGACEEIRRLAKQAMEALEKNSSDLAPVYAAAAALAGSLGPAARIEDERLHPRAYVDRLAGVLAAQRSQLLALPKPNQTVYQEAMNQLGATLEYLDSEWTLGQALGMARECFDRLWKLYPALLQSLGSVSTPPRTEDYGHDIVVPVPRPDQRTAVSSPATNSYPPSRRDAEEAEEPLPQASPSKRGAIWRR